MIEDEKTTLSSAAEAFGGRVAAKLFEGRTGHGGGPCSYRNLRPAEISALAATAYQLGWTQSAQAAERVSTPGANGLTPREENMLLELRNCLDLLVGVLPHAPRIRDMVSERIETVRAVITMHTAS